MKQLVMKNFTASREVLRWIGNLLYWPGGPGLPINKRMAALVLLLVICTFSVAADDFGLDEKIGMVLQMLSSPWVKGIACIALIVECIGLITAGRQEPGMFKKFIPWIAGTILFMAAGTITSKFISVEEDTFNSALELE
jgi:type IV secretory pathway VirB2 component (pilin)